MAHWYTSDPPFGHENILRFCKRPFTSISAMDGAIQANYAAQVAENNDLWAVGGFGKLGDQDGRLERIFDGIPGRKHNNWQGTRNSINIGVDVWGLMPVQAKNILMRAKTLPVNIYWEKAEGHAVLDEAAP